MYPTPCPQPDTVLSVSVSVSARLYLSSSLPYSACLCLSVSLVLSAERHRTEKVLGGGSVRTRMRDGTRRAYQHSLSHGTRRED